jgi:hypothetical protein
VTRAAGLLAAPLWLATAVALAAPHPDEPPAAQRIAVEVRGPVALVTVTRDLPAEGTGERLLDVALPEGAALVDVAVSERGKWSPVEPTPRERATRGYLDGLDARGVAPTREPYDDGTSFRVRVAGDPRAPLALRYRVSLLPETSEGRRRIRFPGSPERQPVPAEVTTSIPDARDVTIAGTRAARARASTRSGWEISWATSSPRARVATSFTWTRVSPTQTLSALSVEAHGKAPAPPPASVLFLVDRSRSVGLPGLAAERDLASRLLEALPPATRFDALFFDRGVRRLFPMSRPATREALAALDAEMVPDRMRNGTDLPGALREAGALLRREASAFTPRAWLVLVTDGALPDDFDNTLPDALGATPGIDLQLAVFVVRPSGDDPATDKALFSLRHLAAVRSGILRELAENEVTEALPRALAALAAGGDVAEIVYEGGLWRPFTPRQLAPGEGRSSLISLPQPPTRVRVRADGGLVSADLRGRAVDGVWLRALAAKPGESAARLLANDRLVALVETPPRAAATVEPQVRGSLDRTVVRNALSLAYMPRARACYLNRTAATRAERDLQGRVRIAIDLTRGEVGSVVVQSSTLASPGIEACLRDGAFELEVPRTLRSDAPSTAVLNLVFRPRTPERLTTPDEAALGAQIDLVIEELHRDEGAATDEPPAADRSMIPTR